MSRPTVLEKPPRGASRTSSRGGSSTSAVTADTAEELRDGWERFWFAPQPTDALRVVRIGLGAIAALYFFSHWADAGYWFGAGGVISAERLGRLAALPEAAGAGQWQLTPLYWIDSAAALRTVLGVGIVASLLTAAGRGGRWSAAVAWVVFLSVAARCWMIAGLAEIPLAFGLGGLVIAGGARGGGGEILQLRWTTGLARRLLEVHTSALLGAAALAQLASEIWWNGEGVLRLVLPVDGPAWELSAVGNAPFATAALTHAVVWVPIICVPLLWVAATRSVAATALIVHALATALLSGHLLYGAANAVLLSLFLTPRGARGAQDGEQR